MAKFRQGATFTATSFENDTSFSVYIDSSEPIGNGSTAQIFPGHTDLGRAPPSVPHSVALKVFTNNMSASHQQMLNRELKAARQVRHAKILPFCGAAEFDMHTILISPYMHNGNLLKYLSDRPDMDCRLLLLEVATAVAFLHANNRVHGDIKSENVLVSNDGHAMLADFGLSTFIEKTASDMRTLTGLRMQMTLRFAAPELVFAPEVETLEDGSRAAPHGKTTATDVYAFAMTIIQAFTRRPPWDSYTDMGILTAMFTRRMHPRPHTGDPPVGLCNKWWNVCVECWSYNPSERPSMATVLEKLTTDSGDNPVSSGHSDGVYGPANAPAQHPQNHQNVQRGIESK